MYAAQHQTRAGAHRAPVLWRPLHDLQVSVAPCHSFTSS
jgi:hypothetical protein